MVRFTGFGRKPPTAMRAARVVFVIVEGTAPRDVGHVGAGQVFASIIGIVGISKRSGKICGGKGRADPLSDVAAHVERTDP